MRRLLGALPREGCVGVPWDAVASRCGVLQRPGLPSRAKRPLCCPVASCCHANAGFEMALGKEAALGELWIGGGKCLTPTSVSVDEARRAYSLALCLSLPPTTCTIRVPASVEKGADLLHPCVGFLEPGGQRRLARSARSLLCSRKGFREKALPPGPRLLVRIHSQMWLETFTFFTSLSRFVSPEKLAYSEVVSGSQHTKAGGHGELRSYQLTRRTEPRLLRFHLPFPPQKWHPCQVSFIFHHCGSFLSVLKQGAWASWKPPPLEGGRAFPGSGEPLLRDPPHRLTQPQRGKSRPPTQAKDAGGRGVPGFPFPQLVMVLNLNISVVLSVRFASEVEGRCSAPP